MPPQSENVGYKTCWEATLKYYGKRSHSNSTTQVDRPRGSTEKSYINFADYKGAATLHFDGTHEGSQAAVDLINVLVRPDCPHTYDMTISGRIA
jgi:hypothetical protein